MADRKIIAVVGATGAQGGGLAHAILRDRGGSFAARALTRKPDSDKAKALADAGAEVVGGEPRRRSVAAEAFAARTAPTASPIFWEHFSPERGAGPGDGHGARRQGRRRAARRSGPPWRTRGSWVPLDDDRMPTLMGKYKVPHFDAKGEADAVFPSAGVPTTFLLTAFYWDNFIHFGMGPKPGPTARWLLTLPMGDEQAARDRGRGYREVRLRHLQAGHEYDRARRWRSPAGTSPVTKWRPR